MNEVRPTCPKKSSPGHQSCIWKAGPLTKSLDPLLKRLIVRIHVLKRSRHSPVEQYL